MKRINAVAGAFLGIGTMLLLRRYPGIFHDSILYMGQGLMQRWPEIYAQDLFFAHGSQASYTIMPWLLGHAFSAAPVPMAMMVGVFFSMLLFAASAWLSLKALLPEQQRYWAWLGALCLPPIYGVVHIFSYNEPFLTSRPLAESFCLLCIGWLARKRYMLAAASLIMAAAFHPLQAITSMAIIWVWAVIQDRRWAHALWLAIPVLAAAIIGLAPFSGLIQQADTDWYKELTYSRQVFVTLWSINDFKNLGLDALVLLIAWHKLRGQFGQWCLASLTGCALGIGTSLILADLLHLVLPIGLQLWRAHWLAHFFSLAAISALLFHHLRAKDPVSAMLLTLTALLAWGETDWGWLLLAMMYLGWSLAPQDSRDRLGRLLFWIFLIAILLLFYNHVSNEYRWFKQADFRVDLYPLDRRLLVFPVLSLGLPLLAMQIWKKSSSQGQKILFACALIPGFLITLRMWDARDSSQIAMEGAALRPDIFGVTIPKHAQVYWEPESLVGTWLVLQRASYFSPGQLAGQMFNRDTAEDGLQRENRMMPLMRESLACQDEKLPPIQRAQCHISDSSMHQACAPEGGTRPDFMVLSYPQRQPSIGQWAILDPLSKSPIVTFRLYRCDDILNFAIGDEALPPQDH